MNIKRVRVKIFTALSSSLAIFPIVVNAQLKLLKRGDTMGPSPAGSESTAGEAARSFATQAGYESGATIDTIIPVIINAFLGILGVIFLLLTIYGGFIWMQAQGNEEEAKKAKTIITQAVIGLAIVLAAYAISYFVVNALQAPTLKAG